MGFFEFLRQHPIYILWFWLVVINVLAFVVMGVDKYKASHEKWRIPEKTLFIFVVLGGSIGGILGMYAFRHKTKHRKFTVGFPTILILQIALGLIIYYYI